MTPEERAREYADAMRSDDRATPWFGMTRDAIGAGTARMSMTVESHHANGHDICHGRVIFAFAD